ncbi:ribosome silencing factor [Candidatus Magnetaquicoccus inordinatus]|uniref:ribosome silencing factor n=1 Tax=Candidatus Magnetaquicoccus inordinatus TaxID=2496818 RepID=UPI00187D5D44|nr:ribosome silencing factor [Candidatus Magnetaquicoccus inordinatus]
MSKTEQELLVRQLKARLDEKKGLDLLILDLRDRAAFTDFFLLATGTSQTHVAALAEEADRFFHERAMRVLSIAGLPEATWVLVDAGDVVVHLFQQEARTFYDLERLWTPPPPQRREEEETVEKPEKLKKKIKPPKPPKPAQGERRSAPKEKGSKTAKPKRSQSKSVKSK